jgi:Protein of unknown function (DUF3108)
MKNLIKNIAIVAGFFVIIFPMISANNCTSINTSFKAGESITYKIYYHKGWMNAGAGEVTFTTALEKFRDRDVYHVIGSGKTYKSYDWFFKVRDVYESYIDTATMQPLKFVRNVSEGSYKTFNNVTFNHTLKKATSTRGVFNMKDCTQDVLSMIFYARNIDFNKYRPYDKIPFSMYIDDETFDLAIKYLGKEKIKIGAGVFHAIKFEPELVKGTLFKADEKMIVWVTDDANHIPLRIESEIAVGAIRVDVIDFKNLRNPMTSFIGTK